MFTSERFNNAIYLGRADDDRGVSFYYVGQATDPGRRWDQHLQRQTGPCPFGNNVTWSVLVWGIPDGKLDSVESYMIGYVLRRFGCVNGNRGNNDAAFVEGFRDATVGRPPAVCAELNLDALDWQEFHRKSNDDIFENEIEPSEGTDLFERSWGFNTLDKAQIVAPFLANERSQLAQQIKESEEIRFHFEQRISTTRLLWFFLGAIAGALLLYFLFIAKQSRVEKRLKAGSTACIKLCAQHEKPERAPQ